ncbi:MAG: hypothetical protein U1G05_04555 [Kiritimatiellia bacterium]
MRVIAATGIAGYSWSPDSRWLVCSAEDSDDNHDVWIVSADGAQPPYNLSRHPDWDGNPEWSPDGRVIAWIGRRFDGTFPIQYAWLRREDRGRTRRDDGTPAGKTERRTRPFASTLTASPMASRRLTPAGASPPACSGPGTARPWPFAPTARAGRAPGNSSFPTRTSPNS